MKLLHSFKDNDLDGREREFYVDYVWGGKYYALFMRYPKTKRKRMQVGAKRYSTQIEACNALQELADRIESKS